MAVRKCHSVESSCICERPKGHNGSHRCRCAGRWYYDKDGTFHIVTLPDISKGFGAFPNSKEQEAIIAKAREQR